MSITFASGLPRVCTSRSWPLPWVRTVHGYLTIKAAGASSAGSRMSGVGGRDHDDVVFASNPSISTSSWLSVCSRSSCRHRDRRRGDGRRVDLVLKMMQGCSAWPARTGHARARRPLHELSTKSEPRSRERHARLAGDRARKQRLAGPGGPSPARPSGLAPSAWNFLDSRGILDLRSPPRLIHARGTPEGDFRLNRRHPLGARLARSLRAAARTGS